MASTPPAYSVPIARLKAFPAGGSWELIPPSPWWIVVKQMTVKSSGLDGFDISLVDLVNDTALVNLVEPSTLAGGLTFTFATGIFTTCNYDVIDGVAVSTGFGIVHAGGNDCDISLDGYLLKAGPPPEEWLPVNYP